MTILQKFIDVEELYQITVEAFLGCLSHSRHLTANLSRIARLHGSLAYTAT